MGGSSKRYRNNQFARACGLVCVRQRPGTVNGVMFMTLEDETGHVSVIVWPSVLEAQRREVRGEPLLAAYGVWHREGEFAISWLRNSSTLRICSVSCPRRAATLTKGTIMLEAWHDPATPPPRP
ncbi:DNA polymerase III alpha subunit [Paraburkholderia sp. HC6.4b]|uniref:Error-prone DNA polymerase n=1 Tax=Paraburkholderia tuberum TaxID=157910 RepID=A0A1H1KHI8_9BURK|nr:DNA polymerase III alpha subunit [Paraburkholderia sp. HC6.4b]MBB5452119.1 DNA polymerase III alpha subunit [Paraburkholderia sp. Kb1A]SDR61249.1 hypothetical protein SAMN05445850_7638 [Paraburkholderia tuberum]